MEKESPCPKKLDLSAPFLSTRRIELPRLITRRPTWDMCDREALRVPFSWEQTPGKRKGGLKTYEPEHIDVPPPKPPPCKWHPSAEPAVNRDDEDKGFDGDVDDDYNPRLNDGDVSDTMDILSLSESVDLYDRNVELSTFASSSTQSPSFIIQRYLLDAKALAAASSAVIPVTTSNNYRRSQSVGRSYASPKRCGLDIFFPWRMKHNLCGVKSPVNPTRRKHNCSLAETPFSSCNYY